MRLFWGPRAAPPRMEEMDVRPVCCMLVGMGGGGVSFHPGSLSLELPSPGALSAGICWHLGDHGRLIYHLCCCSLS